MAPDVVTEVTKQSWFSRIGGSFKGVAFGALLVIAAIPLLFWNEGRAVGLAHRRPHHTSGHRGAGRLHEPALGG